jgi:hypothetical protein
MTVGPIQTFTIEDEGEADIYLTDLLANPDYRSMLEVEKRAESLIKDASLRGYFINKAKAILGT